MRNKIIYSILGSLLYVLAFSQDPQNPNIITEASSPMIDKFVDGVVEQKLIYENRVFPYEPTREADIPWQKYIWRIIDTREKINLPFIYEEMPLFEILSSGGRNGEITLFKDDKFNEQITVDEMATILSRTDTVPVTDPETYETTYQVVQNDLNFSDFKRFKVKEVVYFDKEASRMKVRILGIAPIQERSISDQSSFDVITFDLPIFWVYYPEAREILSRYRVFNEYNDAAPLTWDGLFELRMFSSYIIKESNVFNQELKAFLQGRDMLIEAKNIENKIFNFEQDLWSY